jgi:thiol-disulfide isomerase/thioredoxin
VASKTTDEEGRPAQTSGEFASRQAELFSEGFSFSGYERDLICLNLGDGRFVDISGVSGADSVSDGRATVRADFDNDGDLDIFLRAIHGRAHFLFRNRIGQDGNWLRVALRGTDGAADAFGAVVRVKTAAGVQTKIKAGGSGFLSQSDPRLLFGLGEWERAEWIEVAWPSGRTQRFAGASAGSSVLAVEGEEDLRPVDEQSFALPDPLSPKQRLWRMLRVDRGGPLPRVMVKTLDGRRVALGDLFEEGRPVVVNFWATWCRNCSREMPALQRMSESGIQIVGLSLDDASTRGRIPAFIEQLGIGYPVATIEPDQLDRFFRSRDLGIPLSLVVDGDGRLQEIHQGWSVDSEDRLIDLLK